MPFYLKIFFFIILEASELSIGYRKSSKVLNTFLFLFSNIWPVL